VISDEFWAAVESVMPSDEGKRGNRFSDHRLIAEGIAWRLRTGSPWWDLPADFGPWKTVWKRHHRWSLDGTYDEMFAQVAAVFESDAEVAAGGFDDRACTPALRGCAVGHAAHRGHCRMTRNPRAHHQDSRPDRCAPSPGRGPVDRRAGRRQPAVGAAAR
jgi:transposase